jgi:hypothetical protein
MSDFSFDTHGTIVTIQRYVSEDMAESWAYAVSDDASVGELIDEILENHDVLHRPAHAPQKHQKTTKWIFSISYTKDSDNDSE